MKTPYGAAANLLNTAKRWIPKTAAREQHVNASDLSPEQQKLLRDVLKAREEWRAAHSYFNNASDPALVDHAYLLLEAAERKYMFLLKEAKAQGLTVDAF